MPLNVAYADAGGTIGWQLVGQLPQRKGGSGLLPRLADAPDSGWEKERIPFDRMPFSALLEQYLRDELPTLSAGTQRSYRDSFTLIVEYFANELHNPTLDTIGTREIKGYLAWRRNQRRAGPGPSPRPGPCHGA